MITIYSESQLHKRVLEVTDLDTTETAGDGTIGYVLRVDGVNYWYNLNWVESDMTSAKTNTIVQLVAQLATLPVRTITGSEVQLIAVLEYTSNSGSVDTMEIEARTNDDIEPVKTRVKVSVTTFTGDLSGIQIRAALANVTSNQPPRWRNKYTVPSVVLGETDEYGDCILELVPNSLITPINTYWAVSIGTVSTNNYSIPPSYEVELATLTPVS